jgi:hypothetical protein
MDSRQGGQSSARRRRARRDAPPLLRRRRFVFGGGFGLRRGVHHKTPVAQLFLTGWQASTRIRSKSRIEVLPVMDYNLPEYK